MDEFYNKHYVTLDEQNRIINGFSDAFRQPSETDICINEQGGYQFRLFPNGEENPMLLNENGISLYEYNEGVFARSKEDIAADEAELPVPDVVPSVNEKMAALEEQLAITQMAIDAILMGEF